MTASTDPSDDLKLTGSGPRTSTAFDAISEDLQELRFRAGDVSYAEIAARIARRREAGGMTPAAARVARSTVFDAFRSGRRRINPALIAEIAIALGESEEAAAGWRKRCFEARMQSSRQTLAVIGDPPPLPDAPTAAPETGAGAAERTGPAARREPVPAAAGIPHRMPDGVEPAQLRSMRAALTVALLAACIGLNIFGNTVIMKFELPVFLDMVGTATAAFTLGPWHAVLVSVGTNLATTVGGDPVSLAFMPVNIAGALLWGYGFQRWAPARTPLGFLLLNVAVALACTLVALPITILVFDGVTHSSTGAMADLLTAGQSIVVAILVANTAASVIDKLISGYAALLVSRLLKPLRLRPERDAAAAQR